MNRDINLPMHHYGYGRYVFDTVENQWYDKANDIFIEEEDRILLKLPTKDELIKEKERT